MTFAHKFGAPTLICALTLLASGCGAGSTGAFSHNFPDDRPDHVREVMARLQAAGPRVDPSVAVGVTPSPEHVFVYDLREGRVLWEREIDVATVPHIAGDQLVTQEGSHVIVRALRSGTELTRIADEHMHLIGADGERGVTALSLSTGGAVGARSRIIVLQGGSIAWDQRIDQAIGEPAVHGSLVALPWARQNLSFLDVSSGAEVARVRITRGVVGHAVAQGRHVYYGQAGLARLSESSGSSDESPWFELLERPLPGDPPLLRDSYQPPPSATSAAHRVRLVWRAADGAGPELRLMDDTVYLVFYRLVFALAASENRVRWVAQVPNDVVGAAVEEGGLVLSDETGRLLLLSRDDGQVLWSQEMGMPATYVAIRHPQVSPGEGAGEAPGAIHEQLLAAAQNPDARLVPARSYAASLLAGLPDPQVTQAVIALCDDRSLPPPLLRAACASLALRESGSEHVLTALERHSSYLRGSTAPPVGALAQAAARMAEQRAVPHLIAHLGDPETPTADLVPLLDSLAILGAASASEPIQDFLRLYHAETPDPAMAAALGAAVRALHTLEGPTAQEPLQALIDDPMTMPALRATAVETLRAADAPAEGEGDAETEGEVEAEIAPRARPSHISSEMVGALLQPVRSELRECLVTPGRVHGFARVVIVIEPDGHVALVSVTPPELQACIEPLVRAQSYPATTARGRQQVMHQVRR